MTANKFEIEITAFGKTRTVEATTFDDRRADTGLIFTGRCGRTGQEHWPAYMTLWRQPDGTWRPDFRFYKLNRNTGTLIGWAEDVRWTAKDSGKRWDEIFGAVAR